MTNGQNQKYRVNTLAKELGKKSKDLLDVFADAGREGKNHMAVLDPSDFNFLMDKLTRDHQISSIDDYLNGKIVLQEEKKEEKKEEAKSKEKAQTTVPAAQNVAHPIQAKRQAQDADRSAASQTQNSRSASQQETRSGQTNDRMNAGNNQNSAGGVRQPSHNPSGNRPARLGDGQNRSMGTPQAGTSQGSASKAAKPQGNAPVRTTSERMQQLQQKPKIQPQKPQPSQKNRRPQSANNQQPQTLFQRKAPGENSAPTVLAQTDKQPVKKTRIVDMRTTTVDLSKYDEKLDKFVQDSGNNLAADKQKLKKQNNRDRDAAREKERMALERLRRQEAAERAKKQQLSITLPDTIVVGELASRLKVTSGEVIKRLMLLGVMANTNQTIDYDTASLVAEEMGAKVSREVVVTIEDYLFNEAEETADQSEPRAPVVVVMGHVDHGKTSLLDRIRHTNVTAGEAGGITQHIGAYRVNINGKDITFLDTPGHEAFTAMRARGAQATDIAVLVVAADDGIMPQTVEAINHAKAAGLEIIVAINKMDKPAANPDNVRNHLTNYGLIPEEWGGDVMCVPVSAATGMGINDLLEDILLIAEMKEYKANPNRRAKGTIIEARLDKGRGPVATVLVQNGTLHSGDVVIAGTAVGHVRAMINDKGKNVKTAGPSVPVELIGLSEVPTAGDEFNAVEDEHMARELAAQRRAKMKEEIFKANSKVNLDDLFAQISDGVKELKIILKADVGGSVEAVKAALLKLSNDEVKVNVIHTAVGGIIESDVMLAAASNAIIVGFNVRPDKNALDSAERQKVDIRTYRIIYECIEEIQAALKGMLAPTFKENLLGHASVRQTIHVPNVGTIAGCYVQDGKITRNAKIRVIRDGVVVTENRISSLRRFKDDVREVAQGFECGVGLEKYGDIKIGDVFEAFEMVEVAR